ncbi:MAG: DeoR/GlpR family DNA-binding transcription regulator [Faecalibacterium sp.]
MLAQERRNLILERLQEEKRVVVSALSHEYSVSEETIRRDLERLEKDGFAIKSYGGAVLNEDVNIDMPFNVRKKRNISGKQKIARIVERLVEHNEHITLDASSTSVFIAKALRGKNKLTVVTNSLEVMVELSDVPDWNIISVGGNLREGYLALVGSRALDTFRAYHVEKAFVSCKGLDLQAGVTDGNEDFAQAKSVMLQSAKERYLVVDSSKFDAIAFAHIADLTQITAIVTDVCPPEQWLLYCEQNNIKCYYEE